MSFSTWTLNLLLLTAAPGQVEPPPHAINRRDFKIPIVISAEQRALMKELILYSSTDQGKTWGQVATATPDKDHFRFFAPADGLYWFTVVVVDQQNHKQPDDIYKVEPSQKILVDTIKPMIQINVADREGDEVLVSWDIRDDNLDASTLRLEYRPFDAPAQSLWQTASVMPTASGQTRFRPNYTGPMVVRIDVKDRAGNGSAMQKDVPPATGIRESAVPLPQPTPQPPPVMQQNQLPVNSTYSSPLNRAPGTASLPQNHLYQSNQAAYQQQFQGYPQQPPQPVYPPGGFPPYPPPMPVGQEQQPDEQRAIAVSSGGGNLAPLANPGVAPTGNSALLPPPRVVNDPRIALEYEVRCGNSGVAKVELWLSQDEGRSWRFLTDDPTVGSPIEATLPGEGLFGLKLVVHSGAGLSKGPPIAGDAPDMSLELDATPPLVQLFEPKPDPRRRDTLNISWNASDRNLTPRPVILEWADRPDGAWRLIASDLPGSGTHAWQLTAEIPFRVYLRATAADTAGNRGIAETSKPLLVDLNKPEGRILGIVPVSRPRQ